MIQADANFRVSPETLNQIMIRNGERNGPDYPIHDIAQSIWTG